MKSIRKFAQSERGLRYYIIFGKVFFVIYILVSLYLFLLKRDIPRAIVSVVILYFDSISIRIAQTDLDKLQLGIDS